MTDEQLTPPGTDAHESDPKPKEEATPEPVEAPGPNDGAPQASTTSPAESEPQAPAAPVSDFDLFEAALSALEGGQPTSELESAYKPLRKGEMLQATVIHVERDRVFVNLGTKSEGIVPVGELTDGAIVSAEDHVKVGDKINVVVIQTEGREGNPILSKKRADFEELWDTIVEAERQGRTLDAPVLERVKGGLVVDIGVRGFVPATHVGNGKLRNIEKYVGQTLPLKILEIDRDRRKVVLSNKNAEDEKRDEAKDNIFKEVEPGDILTGVVRRLTDYGAFVDLGGVDGLLHISEMSWARIKHPREMFKEGQEIQVMVLRLDKEIGKISLGHRQVLPDPWNLIRENYKEGQKLTIKIGRLVTGGAFVALPEGAEAFLPLSEMSVRRIRRPQDAVEEDQEVEVQIIELKPSERRMVLSIRALGGGADAGGGSSSAPSFEYDDRDGKRRTLPGKKGAKKGGRRDRDEDEFEFISGTRRGLGTISAGGATIGERLGMLKGLLRDDSTEDADETKETEATDESAEE